MAYTTINKSTDYFNTKLYTGDGSSSRNITGVGFQPDLLWIKNRNATQYHFLFDAVRGVSKAIFSNVSAAESTQASTQTAFLSDGFTVGNDAASNGNGNGIASWNWKAGTTGSGTTGQGKTYNYSVNTTSGFSIMTYQGSGVTNHKIPHHLGVKPMVKIVKSTGHVENWTCYWDVFQNSASYIQLNTTTAKQSDSGKWAGYDTSTLMNLGSDDDTNEASAYVNFVAYCFAEKTGYNKFGSYVGNGSNDGTFIYTGFKPAWIMIKREDGADTWTIYDNKRIGFNVNNNPLFANDTTVESTDDDLDIVSNGFKIRRNSGRINTNGATFIYMAFAAAPLVGTNDVPATAR